MTQRSGWLLRPTINQLPRISYLELFLDLGLIVALSRLSQRLVADFSLLGVVETVVLLAAIWWTWTVTVFTTDWYDPDQPLVHFIVLNVMLGGLLMSAAAVRAFQGRQGVAFAAAYVGLHLVRGFVLVAALRGHPLRIRPTRVMIWFGLTGVLWIGGAFLPTPAHLALWGVAITVDYTIGGFGYPLPGLGRMGPREVLVNGEHMSERYRQMFIVCLGEINLAAVINYETRAFASLATLALILLFLTAVAFWRTYIVYVAGQFAKGIDESPNPVRVAWIAAYAHLIMVTGVLLLAVGGEAVIEAPTASMSSIELVGLVGGPVVFLLGRAMYALTVFRSMLWRLPIAAVLIASAAPALMLLPSLAVAGIAAAAMLTVAFIPHAGTPRYLTARQIRTRW